MIEQIRLLLVEDDADQAALLRRWLETAGYEVVHADHGLNGATMASLPGFDVVLTDLNLPFGSGYDVVTASKTVDRFRPVLVITSDTTMETGVQVMKLRADDCVSKPVNRQVLLAKIERILLRNQRVRDRQQSKVLAIGAHPDDVEIGCGGALLRHKADGADISILTLTCGANGGMSGTRQCEAAAAAMQLGANLIMADFKDTKVPSGAASIQKISEVVRSFQPDFVYTHTASDTHQDHISVHQASLVAARSVRNVLCYQSPSSTIDFRPTRFVDVGDAMEEKIRLIGNHRSQTSKCKYLEEEFILATARYWGRYAGYAEVEPFEVIRQTQ